MRRAIITGLLVLFTAGPVLADPVAKSDPLPTETKVKESKDSVKKPTKHKHKKSAKKAHKKSRKSHKAGKATPAAAPVTTPSK